MIEKIIGISPQAVIISGVILIAILIFLSWIIFKFSPVVLKTTLSFVLFSLVLLISILWLGIFAFKNFITDWNLQEVSRLKEGAFVIIERRKSDHINFIKRFAGEPEKIIEDKLAKTLYDILAIADPTGKVEIANSELLQTVPIPEGAFFQGFQNTRIGVYLITASWSEDRKKIIAIGENVDIRLLPALRDMLSAKDVVLISSDEKIAENTFFKNAVVELGGGLRIEIIPNEENIFGLASNLAKSSSRGIISALVFAVIFFAVLSLVYIRRPLMKLIYATSEVEKGNFEYEIKHEAKGDIGKLISTFNEMIRGLRRRDAQIKYRNELLSAIKELTRAILNEFDKEKIFQIAVETAGIKTNSKCAIFYSDKVKFSEMPSITQDVVEKLQDGDTTTVDGKNIIAYEIGVKREVGKIIYGKFIAERETPFIPEEKEFMNSLVGYVSAACLRSDYVAKLRLLQSIDHTTGLFNSSFFKTSVKREISILNRFQRNFGIVFINIENSKEIIDKFGYIVWEDIVKAIAAIMKKSVRTYDIPARLSEGDFALLLPNTEAKNATVVEERIRNQILSAPDIPALPELELKCVVESTATDIQKVDDIIKKIESKIKEIKGEEL